MVQVATSAPTPPSDRWQKLFPADWLCQPILQGGHQVPSYLRRACAAPLKTVLQNSSVEDLREVAAAAIWTALRYTNLWEQLALVRSMGYQQRKDLSHQGAVISREVGSGRGCLRDAGNWQYGLVFEAIIVMGNIMKLTPEMNLTSHSNDAKKAADTGDCIEAVLGLGMQKMGENWFESDLKLDPQDPVEHTCIRLLVASCAFEDLMHFQPWHPKMTISDYLTHLLGDRVSLWLVVDALDQWRNEGPKDGRLRSWAGLTRKLARDQARAEMRKAKGKGKGKWK